MLPAVSNALYTLRNSLSPRWTESSLPLPPPLPHAILNILQAPVFKNISFRHEFFFSWKNYAFHLEIEENILASVEICQ